MPECTKRNTQTPNFLRRAKYPLDRKMKSEHIEANGCRDTRKGREMRPFVRLAYKPTLEKTNTDKQRGLNVCRYASIPPRIDR